MGLLGAWLLSILLLGTFLPSVSAQTFAVDTSSIAGITVAGAGTAQYQAVADAVLGSARDPETDARRPFGFVVSNNTSQPIVGFAARWEITDSHGQQTERVMTRSLMESSQLAIAPGESVVIVPFLVLAGNHRGIPGSVNSIMTGSDPAEFGSLQNARSIQATLDGVVFASGQFAGPNAANELPYFQAEGAAGYDLASAIIAKKEAGVAAATIVDWLQQAAATRATGSLPYRDWTTAVKAREAGVYLRVCNSGGESKMFAFAEQRLQAPHFAVRP